MAVVKGDEVGKRSRRKTRRKKSAKRRRGRKDHRSESMAKERFDARRGFHRLASISRRFSLESIFATERKEKRNVTRAWLQ